jgi:hypothetical protein
MRPVHRRVAAAAGKAAGQSAASASPSVSGRPEFSSDNGKAPPFRAFAGADTAIGTFSGKTCSNPPFTTMRCALKRRLQNSDAFLPKVIQGITFRDGVEVIDTLTQNAA